MGGLLVRALTGRQGKTLNVVVAASVIGFVFGAFIEVCQSFTTYREASVMDALANGAGAVAGSFLYRRLNAVREG
ncbi:MAG: VanZ family protein [Deltaproteobacteria bacterium]|nr:VanZ family protein [Deltaproteobacteria bacterium]